MGSFGYVYRNGGSVGISNGAFVVMVQHVKDVLTKQPFFKGSVNIKPYLPKFQSRTQMYIS